MACVLKELWIPYRPITLNHFIVLQNLLAIFLAGFNRAMSFVMWPLVNFVFHSQKFRALGEIAIRVGKEVKIPVKSLD